MTTTITIIIIDKNVCLLLFVDRQALAQVSTYQTTLRPYKFYLSFENTLCSDYITEKFFYTFADNDGPLSVALGGLEAADYARLNLIHFNYLLWIIVKFRFLFFI
jgi:hypothetical protein